MPTRVIHVYDRRVEDNTHHSASSAVKELRGIGEKYLSHVHNSRILATDMDGVLTHDDAAVTATRIIGGEVGRCIYSAVAELNIKAAEEGIVPYCWYAPTMFTGMYLLNGVPTEFNRVVGRHTRLISGTRQFIDYLGEMGFGITTITAGHREAAEEVSNRVGIPRTVSTRLGTTNSSYNGTIKSFIGGSHKLRALLDELGNNKYNGAYHGDSWACVETLQAVPWSIAFNPGCEKALRAANICVVGESQLGLLPFYDIEGRRSERLSWENLPRLVTVFHGECSEDLSRELMNKAHGTKNSRIETRLSHELTYRTMEDGIRRELAEKCIPIHSPILPPRDDSEEWYREFDIQAKEAFNHYVQSVIQ